MSPCFLLLKRNVILLAFLLLIGSPVTSFPTCTLPSDCAPYLGTQCLYDSFSGTNVCVECLAPSDCPATFTTPLCTAGGICTESCIGDPNICNTAAAPVCDTSGLCVSCTGPTDCSSFSGTQCLLDTSLGSNICAECVADTDCTSTASPVCSAAKTCGGCSGHGDCNIRFPSQPYCDGSGCVECLGPTDCPGTFVNPLCTAEGICIESCTGNPGICNTAAAPLCDGSGLCVPCAGPGDCLSFPGTQCLLDTSSGSNLCAECIINDDCPLSSSAACGPGNVCGGCTGDGDCGGTRFPTLTQCDASNACVECLDDNDCTLATAPVCGPGGTCIGCSGAGDCNTKFPSQPLCDGSACVECLLDTDCLDPALPVCGTGGACTGCSGPGDCNIRFPAQPFCDGNGCVECLAPIDCPSSFVNPLCLAAGVCIESCVGNPGICNSPGAAVCDGSGLCIPCAAPGDCAASFPGTQCLLHSPSGLHLCVECLTNTECTSSAAPACMPDFTCGACTSPSDCGDARFPTHTICNSGACVECIIDDDCTDPTAPVCGSGGTCTGCSGPGDCSTKFPLLPYCDGSACVQCTGNGHCPYTDPVCTSGTCGPCSSHGDCGTRFPGRSQCNPIAGCVECYGGNSACTNTALSTCVSDSCSACSNGGQCLHMTGGNTKCAKVGTATTGVCGVCQTNNDCPSYTNSQCSITAITSSCVSCTNDSGCSKYTNHKFCESGVCGYCHTNLECTNLANPRCDLSSSMAVCATCIAHTDCQHLGKMGCVSNVCYDCGIDDHCPLVGAAQCHPISHTCTGCTSDIHCAHLAPADLCTTSSVCKAVKAVFTTQSNTRIIPEKRISFVIAIDSFPVSATLSHTWSVSTPGIAVRIDNRQQLQLRNFETISPRPLSITIAYALQNSLGDTDTINKVIPVNRPPVGGTVTVTPSSGQALSTSFTITASGWTDPDGDVVKYRFYYAIDEQKNYVALNAYATTNTLTTLLPSGTLEDAFIVYIKVSTIDNWNVEGVAETSTYVSVPVKTVPQALTELQTLIGSTPSQGPARAMLLTTYLEQFEKQLANSPLSTCPICSYHGTCSSGKCVCDAGYKAPGCSLTQTEYDSHIALKDQLLDIMITEFTNSGLTSKTAEQSLYVIKAVTANKDLVSDAIASKALGLLDSVTAAFATSPINVHIDEVQNVANATENLFKLIRDDCTRSSAFAASFISKFQDIMNSLTTIEIKMNTNPNPNIVETDTFYVCMQQDVLAKDLKGKTIYMCGGVSIKFPSGGVNVPDNSYVDIEFILPKSNYYDCISSSISLSPYKLYIKEYKTQNIYVTINGDMTIIYPVSLGMTCPTNAVLQENEVGDLVCVVPVREDNIQNLILGSNIFKLGNISALAHFDILSSLLFYIVVGFTLLMTGVSIWSVHKDKNIDRDVIVLPKKSPSKLYRMMVYILISHTFFGIFALFDKNQPRIMRSVLFYIKVLGLMAVSTIFNQSETDLGSVQKAFLSIITIVSVTPISLTVGYLVFKRQLDPKIRRKRQALQARRIKTPEEKEAEEKQKKRAKMFNKIGYSLVVFVVLGYLYIIFVITANNAALGGVVKRWLEGFLQSWAIDFFGVQIGQVFIHLGIISTLQQESKKKFLCIPRKHLPKMVNPNIFDYKKRFAALDRLYKHGMAYQENVESTIDNETEDSSPYIAGRMNRMNSILKTAKTRNTASNSTLADIQADNTMERIDLTLVEKSEMTEANDQNNSPLRRTKLRSKTLKASEKSDSTGNITEQSSPSPSPGRKMNKLDTLQTSERNDSLETEQASPGRKLKRQSRFVDTVQEYEETEANDDTGSKSLSPGRKTQGKNNFTETVQASEQNETLENTEQEAASPGRRIRRQNRNNTQSQATLQTVENTNEEITGTLRQDGNNTRSEAILPTVENTNGERARKLSRVKTLQGRKFNLNKKLE